MAVYQITKIEVNDQAKLDEYVAAAGPLIESAGGKFLARNAKVNDLDGNEEDCIAAIIEWPNRTALEAFISSPARKDLMELRDDAGEFDVSIIDGI
jgi:uncharacterized protein (DUF1330 family)